MNESYRKRILRLILIIIFALAFIVSSSLFLVTQSRYVTEMGGTGSSIGGQDNDLGNEVMTPFNVGTPLDLFNAIASGYNYVRLSSSLSAPIVMTGDSLDLQANLTLDLNGNEIQRSSRAGLVTVSKNTTLTIIDTKGGGGLYNPTGNVLAIGGGELNVFGGKFESGPRPAEYYSKLCETAGNLYSSIPVAEVTPLKSGTPSKMPILPVRKDASGNFVGGNVYFDKMVGDGTSGSYIASDTYCYVAVNGKQLGETTSFDVEEAAFVYSYMYEGQEVTVFGFKEVVQTAEQTVENDEGRALYNNFAAIQMQSGKLNVNVNADGNAAGARASEDGSFYSYFGTQHTSCVYMSGGEMDVKTTGTFSTVDPASLPDGSKAKNGEGSCIISERLRDSASGGVLNITKLGSAYTYNGSIIAMRGGTLTASGANFIKKATLSHTDDPRPRDDASIDKSAMDAAIFMRGGKVLIKNSKFTVEKDLGKDPEFKTTYGILARGTNSEEVIQTDLDCIDTDFVIHGSDSYGIYATRGNIDIVRGDITITSGSNSFGVYAVNMGTAPTVEGGVGDAVNLNLDSTTINIAKKGTLNADGKYDLEFETYVGKNPEGMGTITITNPDGTEQTYSGRATSVGVYLNSIADNDNGTKTGGKVTVNDAEINSQGMGVAVNGGSLTFKGGAKIKAYNATAIGVNAGTLTFEDSDKNYDVDCELNRQGYGVSSKTQFDFSGKESSCMVEDDGAAKAAATHQYAIYVPWQRSRNHETGRYTYTGIYENNNAIRVQGGAFNCYGQLNLNFRGLYNDYDLYKTVNGDTVYFDNLVIKSFAIACYEGTININRCNVVSAVGGGVKVQGGTIVLGDENNATKNRNNDIIVKTLGKAHYYAYKEVAEKNTSATWHFYPNLSGGPAIVSRSGDITVHYGKFTAEFGNGVTATNDDATKTSLINVYDGVFTGNLSHSTTHTYETAAGPASHYGLQVMGSATVNIYGGNFDGKNGGAFVRGQSAKNVATVNIFKGTFGTESSQDGFNISEFSDITFGAYKSTDEDFGDVQARQNYIHCHAYMFTLAVNPVLSRTNDGITDYKTRVRVFYGTYYVHRNDKQRPRLGLGAIADDMYGGVSFYIYNYGADTITGGPVGAVNINSRLIRCQGDSHANNNFGFDNSETRVYCNSKSIVENTFVVNNNKPAAGGWGVIP